MAELTGTVLGRYRVGAVIGYGGFSTVYQAIDERFESPVAVKVLAENHALNLEVRERFLAEAQLQRRLAGAGVVAVHDLGETEAGQPYTVMALSDGGDLASRVAEASSGHGGGFAVEEVERVADALARSLGALHANGIVHRDVKPGNLLLFGDPGGGDASGPEPDSLGLLARTETLLLGDLGFAKQLGQMSGLTVSGGTPGFRPPEQEQIGVVDCRADVYSASAVIFWLLTGLTPGPDLADGERALLEASVNPELAGVVVRGLAAAPTDRQPTIAAWAEEISLACAPAAVGGGSAGQGHSPPRRTRRWAMASALALAVGACLAAAVALGVPIPIPDLGGLAPNRSGAPGGSVRVNDDGTTSWTVSDEEGSVPLRLTVTGPELIELGDSAEFVATVEGARSLLWIGADGTLYEGRQRLLLVGSEPGRGSLTALATADDGRTVTVTAEYSVPAAQGE